MIKKTFGKNFAVTLDFDFFKHPVYPHGLKEDLIVRLELNSSEMVILYTGDTAATYKISDISVKYDAIFGESHTTTIGELYAGTTSIPYTKVTSTHYQTMSKKTLPGRLTWTTYLFVHYHFYCYYFLINVMSFQTKMKNFTTPAQANFNNN